MADRAVEAAEAVVEVEEGEAVHRSDSRIF
jgi:hypothetical protein